MAIVSTPVTRSHNLWSGRGNWTTFPILILSCRKALAENVFLWYFFHDKNVDFKRISFSRERSQHFLISWERPISFRGRSFLFGTNIFLCTFERKMQRQNKTLKSAWDNHFLFHGTYKENMHTYVKILKTIYISSPLGMEENYGLWSMHS